MSHPPRYVFASRPSQAAGAAGQFSGFEIAVAAGKEIVLWGLTLDGSTDLSVLVRAASLVDTSTTPVTPEAQFGPAGYALASTLVRGVAISHPDATRSFRLEPGTNAGLFLPPEPIFSVPAGRFLSVITIADQSAMNASVIFEERPA